MRIIISLLITSLVLTVGTSSAMAKPTKTTSLQIHNILSDYNDKISRLFWIVEDKSTVDEGNRDKVILLNEVTDKEADKYRKLNSIIDKQDKCTTKYLNSVPKTKSVLNAELTVISYMMFSFQQNGITLMKADINKTNKQLKAIKTKDKAIKRMINAQIEKTKFLSKNMDVCKTFKSWSKTKFKGEPEFYRGLTYKQFEVKMTKYDRQIKPGLKKLKLTKKQRDLVEAYPYSLPE